MPVTLRRDHLVALAIVGVAAGLRLWGIGFGLPRAEARPDELTIAFQAMKFGSGDLDPHSFNYPSLHKYACFALFGVWYVVGRVAGFFADQHAFLVSFFDGAVTFRLLMRLWSAALGTLTVALLLRGPGSAWSAALLAVSYLPVRDSHFGVTDTQMVFLAVAAVLACEAHRVAPSTRRLVLAAVLAGLATSTKYNAGLLCVPLALAAGDLRSIVLAGAVMVGAFLAGTPYAALDFPTFWTDFRYEATHLSTGQYIDVGNAWIHHAVTLWRTCGFPYVLLAGVGLFYTARLGWRRAGVLYGFPLVYFAVIGRGESAFFRYILPVVPFCAMAAGEVLAAVPRRPAAFVLLLVAAFPTALAAVRADRLFAAGDTRDAMATWIETHVPSEAVLVHAGAYTGAPMLQRNVANQTREYLAKADRADTSGFRKPDDLSWYVPTRPMYDVFFVEKPGIDYASVLPVDRVLADPPVWLLVEDYFLTHYSAVPTEIRALADSPAYTLVHTESATDGDVHDPWFDQQDALYLPAGDTTGFTRMGPTLRLYRRIPP